MPVSRRTFLSSAAALAAVPLLPTPGYGLVRRSPQWAAYPFSLGVASGDPTPTGVVLWTRLAPQPLDGGGMTDEAVEVAWQIANDEGITDIVASGKAIADPGLAHSVHVEADGLKPGHWYFYRFTAGGEASPSAAPAPPRRLMPRPSGCGSPLPVASIMRAVSSRPCGTWRPNRSTWRFIWATTSTIMPATMAECVSILVARLKQ